MSYNSSDLTSVLNTLSALSNPALNAAQIANLPNDHQHNASQHPEKDDDAYEPTDTLPASNYPPIPNTQPQPQHLHTNKPAELRPDTSSITTWPPALRHVMRTVAINEDLQRRIRQLMGTQHEHERQWWAGREALCRKQRARVEKKRELDEVLRSVGAPVDESKDVSTAEENTAELQNYDTKIHAASTQMAHALLLELRGLGIPFFSIRRDLVVDSDAGAGPGPGSLSKDGDKGKDKDNSKEQGKLSRDGLLDLQWKMLELLVDLCKE